MKQEEDKTNEKIESIVKTVMKLQTTLISQKLGKNVDMKKLLGIFKADIEASMGTALS